MTAVSSLCARPLTPRATCRACLEACPRDAIRIASEVRVSEACDGCGLCVAACDNGVFDTRWGFEADLLARIRGGRQELTLACEAVAGLDDAFVVACLGVMTESVLLEALSDGVPRIEMVHGPCPSCLRRPGEALFRRSIRRAAALWRGELPVTEREVPGKGLPDAKGHPLEMSRRGLFAVFSRTLSTTFRQATPENTRRRRLLQVLGRIGSEVPATDPGLFSDLEVTSACTGCPVCQSVCPAKAIRRLAGEDTVVLGFDPRRCTGCDNCQVACPEGAITRLSRSRPIGTPSSPSPRDFETIATIPLRPCPSCRTPMGGPRPLCPSCLGRAGRARLVGESTV